MLYNVKNWYWVVASSTTEVYSSAAAAYVSVTDATYEAWLAAGNIPTKIISEAELQEVFAAQYPAGWPQAAISANAQTALDKSDITVLRCVSAGVTVPNAWQSYRSALRAIVNGTDTTSTSLPTTPSYPSGT